MNNMNFLSSPLIDKILLKKIPRKSHIKLHNSQAIFIIDFLGLSQSIENISSIYAK